MSEHLPEFVCADCVRETSSTGPCDKCGSPRTMLLGNLEDLVTMRWDEIVRTCRPAWASEDDDE